APSTHGQQFPTDSVTEGRDDEDHDLPAAGRTLRPRPPRPERRRGHQGPGQAPPSSRQGRRRDPPPGPPGDEVPLDAPQAVAGLVQRREVRLRGAARGLTRAVGRRRIERGGRRGRPAPAWEPARPGPYVGAPPPPRKRCPAHTPPVALGGAIVRCGPVRDAELHAPE